MKYYLSSYKFGDKIDDLKRLITKNNKNGHIKSAAANWPTVLEN